MGDAAGFALILLIMRSSAPETPVGCFRRRGIGLNWEYNGSQANDGEEVRDGVGIERWNGFTASGEWSLARARCRDGRRVGLRYPLFLQGTEAAERSNAILGLAPLVATGCGSRCFLTGGKIHPSGRK